MPVMTNIAGQTRDETQRLNCPKCKAAMEKVLFTTGDIVEEGEEAEEAADEAPES